MDGYTSAQVVWATDRPLEEEEHQDGIVLGHELIGLLHAWMQHVRRGWERRVDQVRRDAEVETVETLIE